MIEILNIQSYTDKRAVTISVSDGVDTYLHFVGGLPLDGDLQPILDAREAELFAVAQRKGRVFDVFDVTALQVAKGIALVMLDEINLLRSEAGLSPRDESQIRTAIKAKLRE